SMVSPVNTRVVIHFSSSFSVAHDWMSLDSGTFSGSQKLLVSRFQTSTSFSSSIRFQLMACTRLTSGSFSETVISSPSDTGGRGWAWAGASQHAADATLHLSAFQRQLPQPAVGQALEGICPRFDWCLVSCQ